MSSKKFPSHPAPTSAAAAAERLAAIVDAAERAASSVIDGAEQQAQQQLEEARARADRIIAERLRELADELDPPAQVPAEPYLRPVESSPEPLSARGASAGARLLATQMAVSGSSREEIEARLRSGFDIEDTAEILDAILGPEE